MAASLGKSPCALPRFLGAGTGAGLAESRRNGASFIVCKSQRNSRYEKSQKHARQGQATTPKEAPAVPSELRTKPGVKSSYPKPSEIEADKGKASAPQPEHIEIEEQPENPSVNKLTVNASDSAKEQRSSKREERNQSSGSHWDDFWAPRLFWVFRALGTVVD